MAECKWCLIKLVADGLGFYTKDNTVSSKSGHTKECLLPKPLKYYIQARGDHSRSNINQCPLSFLSQSSDSSTVLQLSVYQIKRRMLVRSKDELFNSWREFLSCSGLEWPVYTHHSKIASLFNSWKDTWFSACAYSILRTGHDTGGKHEETSISQSFDAAAASDSVWSDTEQDAGQTKEECRFLSRPQTLDLERKNQ